LFYGGTVKAIEPDPESYELLCENIGESNCENKAVCSDPHPSYGYRKGYIKKGSKAYFNQVMLYPRGMQTDPKDVINVHDFGDLLYEEAMLLKGINGYTVPICIKMDIEGAELQILDDCSFTCMDFIDKMVIAYHTNVDNTRTGFMRRVAKLSETFHVTHQEIKQEYINIFPNEIMIYCQRKK
jgi:FkbM family methyltransferase